MTAAILHHLKLVVGQLHVGISGELSANKLSSIIFSFVAQLKTKEKKMTMWLCGDRCTYHDRNVILCNSLLSVAIKKKISVYQKYLVQGHTQMECDSMHCTIERRLAKLSDYHLKLNAPITEQNAALILCTITAFCIFLICMDAPDSSAFCWAAAHVKLSFFHWNWEHTKTCRKSSAPDSLAIWHVGRIRNLFVCIYVITAGHTHNFQVNPQLADCHDFISPSVLDLCILLALNKTFHILINSILLCHSCAFISVPFHRCTFTMFDSVLSSHATCQNNLNLPFSKWVTRHRKSAIQGTQMPVVRSE